MPARFSYVTNGIWFTHLLALNFPAHPKARSWLESRVFDRLTSFAALETRIAALPTVHERGEAFEVFVEAYFATLATEKAKQVWPGTRVPPSLRKRLALTLGDKGVDGVFETQLGEYHAYQAKFRTGRPSLTWDELSTFIGLADRVDQRVLITNCDRCAEVVSQRTGFYAITGNDLDKLTAQDFTAIRAWLKGAKVKRPRRRPLPHQIGAIDSLLPALRDHDRATALMACGTGKTLVSLWVADKLTQASNLCRATEVAAPGVANQPPTERDDFSRPIPAPRILVLVPSLALLRQILHEWAREASWPSFAHLCVCSDPTVKPHNDELFLRATDLDFPVTTDPKQVRRFLAADFDGVKLVFATYQSAHVVASGMRKSDAFDLAIFDEAHKTAGREGVHFSFALNDKNLPIRKRLFLTATPRHFDIRRRDKEGDARLVYSMDAPEVYGPVAHKLSFAEAARRGIICDYKVVISVVTSDMVNDHLLRHGEVIVKGDAVKARHVASQLALQAAVARHGVRKIFTFHRSVASAAAFTGEGAEGIGNHLAGFLTCHVNGAMPASEREHILTEFRDASRAIISNAKCLTEGVDVPAVDMVAFLAPKRSRVDIVQATGRAMRKAPGKTTGYVLVPLFVEQAKGETIEEALARTDFDQIWSVLQAMQEQDDLLAEIIRQMREERGRTKGFDDTRFRERVEFLGPQISLKMLHESITTACVEVLGDNWDERFGQLKAFKERFGHCNVPRDGAEHPQLGGWVKRQRDIRKHGTLDADRFYRLNQIGFVWDPYKTYWEEMFARLAEYQRIKAHCNVPQDYPDDPQLGTWASKQRDSYRAGKMNQERIRRLDQLGFIWEPSDAVWEQMLEALREHKREKGHCKVSRNWPRSPHLAHWVLRQRQAKKNGTLTEERIRRLQEAGLAWTPQESLWEQRFAELVEYKLEHGHCNVLDDSTEHPELARWVGRQRQFRKASVLDSERIRRLEEIGFQFDPRDTVWEQMFTMLLDYKRRRGNCNVPAQSSEDRALAAWVRTQRRQKKNHQISDERVQRLKAAGFAWKPFDAYWEEMFAALVEYKRQNGNCDVPAKYSKNPQLGTWVGVQRLARKRRKITDERMMRLEDIGFQWEINSSKIESK